MGASGCLRAKASSCWVSEAPRWAAQVARSSRARTGLFGLHHGVCHFEVAQNHGQQVVEVVGDAACQLPHRLKALCVPRRRIGADPFGGFRHGQNETAVGHCGTPELEAAAIAGARALVDHWLVGRRTVPAADDLSLGLEEGDAPGRKPFGKRLVGGARTHHGVWQAQQTGKPIVPPHQMATGIECADTLAEAIERRTHLACHGALLGFGCRQLPARPCQESGAEQQQPDRQAGTTQCEKASVGVGAVAFAAPFIEQAFLLGAHVGQGRIDLSHKAPSEIRLLDRQRGAEPVPTAERDRLRQILELALKQRRQCTQTILLVGVVGGQRNQLALQLDGAPDGIVVRAR